MWGRIMGMKITVLGVHGYGSDFTTGQAVKSIELINWLQNYYGEDRINIVNTYNWKKNPFLLLFRLFSSFFNSSEIIILPAQNGVRYFAPIIYFLNIFFNRSIHYLVVGGWLYEMLSRKKLLRFFIKSFDGVYVEIPSMIEKLNSLELNNVFFLPNVRKEGEKKYVYNSERSNVCIYSRITEAKGIEDAIKIVQLFNLKNDSKLKLDIYGKIDPEYKEKFSLLLKKHNSFVEYKGVKNSDEGLEVVSNYKALIFPTYYEGEGFAGTLLDAFGSATPVIANDWKYNSEIIDSGTDGFVYPFRDIEKATLYLENIILDKQFAVYLSLNASNKFKEFIPDYVYPTLTENFKEN